MMNRTREAGKGAKLLRALICLAVLDACLPAAEAGQFALRVNDVSEVDEPWPLVDYGMRRHVWGLFGRSGDRTYYEYGSRFNRFAGDWEMAHWTAGKKFRGGFAIGSPYDTIHLPLYWDDESQVLVNDISGHDIQNWLLEHYFTGHEYPLELTRMFGEAMRQRWDLEAVLRGPSPFMILRVLTSLYTREWDEAFHRMAQDLVEHLIDLDSANGLTDAMRFGALYKVDRNSLALYDYYLATGYEPARQAMLKAIDYQYRFDRIPPPISCQNASALLFTVASQKPAYLRVVNQLVASGVEDEFTGGGPHLNMHPTLGMPAALGLLAEVRKPLPPFPLLEYTNATESSVLFRKTGSGQPLEMRLFVQMSGESEPTSATWLKARHGLPAQRSGAEETKAEIVAIRPTGMGGKVAGVLLEAEEMLRSPLARHVRLTIPADTPDGLYTLTVPGTSRVVVQEMEAAELGILAPDGFRVRGDGVPYYFQVPKELTQLRLILSRPMEIRRPDAVAAVEASNQNIGPLSVPVEGRGGLWSFFATHPGYVRLLNVEPVVAYGRREALPVGAGARPAERFTPPPAEETFVAGRTGRALHLAATWRLSLVKRGTAGEFTMFVNGLPVARCKSGSPTLPGPLSSGTLFGLKETDESVILGPLDGAIEQLRISDVVRYQEAFAPPDEIAAADDRTRVMFPFNGDYAGTTGDGETVHLEVLAR